MKQLIALSVLALAFLFSPSLRAQSYSIDWYTVDGGGGDSSGGNYTLSGTIGQPDAGNMTGGTYSLAGGYWSMISTGSEGVPSLSVILSGLTATISWPAPATGFVLEQSTNMIPGTWSTVPPTTTNNGVISSVRSATGKAMMYRLHQQ